MNLKGLFGWLFCLWCSFSFIYSHEEPKWIPLKGFLGKEEISRAKALLEPLKDIPNQKIILQISSSSGDLMQVLDLGREIYELKALINLEVYVYIDDNAVGPAAIFPFLADKIFGSLVFSWGDIPWGSEGVLPTNVLSSRVRSLIEHRRQQTDLFLSLATAMSDPHYHPSDIENLSGHTLDQTLVLNQQQAKTLGLVEEILPLDVFKQRFKIATNTPKEYVPEGAPSETSPLLKDLENRIHFASSGVNKVGHILIGDRDGSGINESTWLYVKKALEYYQTTRPIFIILELNTPGGEVFAAQKISDALIEMDTQFKIPVVAFINNWAISAGAMLAYSCRFITTVKEGVMGAAEPVITTETGQTQSASEKINSALRTDFASRATFFGRNPWIAQAMVDKDLIIVYRHGQIIKLDSENQIRTTGPEPDRVISPKGKLLTLTAEEMIEDGVANLLLLPQSLEPITNQELHLGSWPGSKMVLFHEPFFDKIPNAEIDSYRMDWKTQFFVWLASPIVSSLLLMGLIIGAYIEFNHPGVSLPGLVALICLILIILSSFSLEIASWLELIFLATGFLLIFIELFFLPSFGLIGILGIFVFMFGLVGMMLPGIESINFDFSTQTLNAAGEFLLNRLVWYSVAFLLSVVIIILLARYVLPAFRGFNPFVLHGNEQEASRGYVASGEIIDQLPPKGAEGLVLASLRPAGKVIIETKIYDAISHGSFIEKDQKVVVVSYEGSVVVVDTKD